MPIRVIRFVLRHSGRFFGRIRCWIRGRCRWQYVQFGDDVDLRQGRICVSCKREEIEEIDAALKEKNDGREYNAASVFVADPILLTIDEIKPTCRKGQPN